MRQSPESRRRQKSLRGRRGEASVEKINKLSYAYVVSGERWLRPEADQPWAGSGNYMYYVYILKSRKNNKLYKGFTSDLKRRFHEHNSGKSTFTKNNKPWDLVYYEAFLSEKDARIEEIFLKSGKGKERIKYLLANIN